MFKSTRAEEQVASSIVGDFNLSHEMMFRPSNGKLTTGVVQWLPSSGGGFMSSAVGIPFNREVYYCGIDNISLPPGGKIHWEFNHMSRSWHRNPIPFRSDAIPYLEMSHEDWSVSYQGRRFRQCRPIELGLTVRTTDSSIPLVFRFSDRCKDFLNVRADGSLGGSLEPIILISTPYDRSLKDLTGYLFWSITAHFREVAYRWKSLWTRGPE